MLNFDIIKIFEVYNRKVTDNKKKNSQPKLRVEDFLLFAVVFCGGSCSMTAHRRCRLAL